MRRYVTFFDLVLLPRPEIPKERRLARMLRVTHVAGAKLGIRFAIAFPEWTSHPIGLGETLRVFAESRDLAARLLADMQSAQTIDRFARETEIRDAPETDQFEAYLKRRIYSENPRRTREAFNGNRLAWRRLPFLWMRSSSGLEFKLLIERIEASPEQCGTPNSYGLSPAANPVALPIVAPKDSSGEKIALAIPASPGRRPRCDIPRMVHN